MGLYLTVDGWAGGDARDRRDMARQEMENEEEQNRMRELEELQRGRSGVYDCQEDLMMSAGDGEDQDGRGPSPFVNGSAHRT